jgi:hypothetical protein
VPVAITVAGDAAELRTLEPLLGSWRRRDEELGALAPGRGPYRRTS